MPFTSKEVDLIDSWPIQRLRGIRQLALASLVFPGALHTRFDHTLGVAHLVGLMSKSLDFDDDQHRLVRFAALLHDIGHGPFSHVSENALERYADRERLPSDQKKEKIHELITAQIILENRELRSIVGEDDCRLVSRLLSDGHGDPAIRAVVSGPLDADKQDYLLRDSRFCGVDYGRFDFGQFHRSLVIEKTDAGRELMIRQDGVHTVEQFVLAKYYMTSMVYRHKVRLITDQMIVRAIVLGIEKDRVAELRRLYAYDGSADFVDNYLAWDDARFMRKFGVEATGGRCKELLDRLVRRQLLKRVFSRPIRSFDPEIRESLMKLGGPENAGRRAATEAAIADYLGGKTGKRVEPDFVILHGYQIKSARESSRNDEAGILVSVPGKPPGELEEESTLFKS
ncbi:MAG: hypothetical protein BWK77_06335, partial [Verrucomicrobia bacterium A1]